MTTAESQAAEERSTDGGAGRRTDLGTGRPVRTWALVAWVALGAATGALAVMSNGDDDGPSSTQPVTIIGIAVLSYLAAAVVGRRRFGWVAAGIFAVLVVLADLADIPKTVVFLVAAVLLTVVGLVVRPRATVPQALALVGYLGAAAGALLLAPRIGLAIAGMALAVHVVWDVIHYRREAVVDRSLALWCIGLDLVVGGTCVIAAVAG